MKRAGPLLKGLLAVVLAANFAMASSPPQGGRVSWGRMMTTRDWNIHSDRDPDLAAFIKKETTLNIDPTWYAADPGELEQLCRHPLLYVKDLSYVRRQQELENIGEYLKRGGFLCIDTCIAHTDMEAYYRRNREILQRLVPDGELRPLPESDPIYHCYFDVSRADIFTPDMGPTPPGKHDGVYGLFEGDRMVAVVSMYGLECDWPQTPKRTRGCMKMIVNMYVCAMTGRAVAKTPSAQ